MCLVYSSVLSRSFCSRQSCCAQRAVEWVSVVKTEECVAAQRAEISTALIVPMLFKSEKKKKKDEPPAATTRTHTRVGARFFHV